MSELPTPRDIERLAFDAGISMTELCRRAGVAYSTFSRWKADVSSVKLSVVDRLIRAAKPQPEGKAIDGRQAPTG